MGKFTITNFIATYPYLLHGSKNLSQLKLLLTSIPTHSKMVGFSNYDAVNMLVKRGMSRIVQHL